jgi:aspartate beta-hydroxylase
MTIGLRREPFFFAPAHLHSALVTAQSTFTTNDPELADLVALHALQDASNPQTALAFAARREAYVLGAYETARKQAGPKDLVRIDRSVAGYLGKAEVFSSHPTQHPKFLFIPGLRSGGFLDAAKHPLTAPLSDHFYAIRDEFDAAVAEGQGIVPFMGELAPDDATRYVSGPASAAWDALFFFRHGKRHDTTHASSPATGALLDSLDLCRIDGQAPEICFSLMRPGTRIEPHHGVTNARVVMHLPLRVPEGCHLELTGVGRHFWREGQVMVFDDTFEHSALNPSSSNRGILLMDAWHPELTDVERSAFKLLVEAITRLEQALALHTPSKAS